MLGGAMQMGGQGIVAAFFKIVAVGAIGGSLLIGNIQDNDIVGTDPTNQLIIANGTAPTATSDGIIFIGAKDISGESAMTWFQETDMIPDTDEAGFSHVIPINFNGTTMYLMATDTAP